jgi:hypothetical protein
LRELRRAHAILARTVSKIGDWTRTSSKRLTAAEMAWRNKRIADAHTVGFSWFEIAERERVSVATARRAAREHAESVARLGSELPPVGLPESARACLWLREPEGADPEAVRLFESFADEGWRAAASLPEVGGARS